jgi:hypothetical protein
MININLIKSKVIPIFLIFSLVGVLFITIYMVKQRQDIRSKAVGTGKVTFFLGADHTSLNSGESTNISVMMHNTTTDILGIRVAGVSVQFDSKVFTPGPVVKCDTNIFRENPIIRSIGGEIISFTCIVEGGNAAYQFTPSHNIVKLADMTLTATSVGQVDSSVVRISRAILPLVQTYTDVSNSDLANAYMSFNIAVPHQEVVEPTVAPVVTESLPEHPPLTECFPGICPNGCCSGYTCNPGDSDTACGSSGAACVNCTSNGQTCVNRTCQFVEVVEPTVAPVATESPPDHPPLTECFRGICPNGCCSGYTCNSGDSDTACGSGGAACTNCASTGQSCINKTCQWVELTEPTVGPVATESPPDHPPLAP